MPTTIVRFCRALVLPALAVLLLAGCLTDQEQSLAKMLNDERTRAGLAPLQIDDDAQAKAQLWAAKMAAAQQLSHSNIVAGIGGTWTRLGENIAAATSISGLYSVLMSSSDHRARILDGRFTHVGVGIAEGADGLLYTTQVFVAR